MEQVPVTVRIPKTQLDLIDSYAIEQNVNRSDLIRNLINDMVIEIKKQRLKNRLMAASKKVSMKGLEENAELETTLDDGLNGY